MKILLAILIFSFIVLFHELGHFLVAKKCNVRVNEFMLGLGPKLFGIQRGETLYSIHLFPFGGACVMEGEEEESEDERSFAKKNVWQRMAICFAGPLFNFILAYILSVILIAAVGYYPATIGQVSEGSAAEAAGIEAGDRITSLNGYQIHFYQEISVYTFFHPGKDLEVTYERDGSSNTVSLTPTYDEETGRYLLGVVSDGTNERGSVFNVLKYGFYEIKYQIYVTVQSLRMLFTGQVGIQDMSGPVGIVEAIGDTYDASVSSGVFYVVMNMINFMILLSANLGVMNLLPIPALDGGRILIYIVEVIRRKPLNQNLEAKINFVGFVLLMGLMVIVMYQDIVKLFH